MSAPVSDQLWQEFHTVVNMNSRELEDWLRTSAADEQAESVPDEAGSPLGRRVADVLRKRRVDLTASDAAVMERVVHTVRSQRDAQLEPTAGDRGWRQRLMSVGHDPLKPPGSGQSRDT
ncbi:MAG TPA: DUF3140 domain-containing protein [Actinocrinis sp.]|jgi:hypothetical protein|uniref:DUF3140 domain-containing protein n=1 Tax=Actinocrinis sp. TaxID=1920516 RepID=UPI002D3F30E7|nr:DUF3140 domain-containing protein [Actinocrinis sp.]HZU57009.1 DUF3140 domain-containing protein [Actinocrinis sp.]